MPLSYDSPTEQARHEAIMADLVWAELDLARQRIDVWWPRERNIRRKITDAFKAIGGKGTDGAGGWIPLSLTNAKALRTLFGEDLELSDELNDWAFAEIDRVAEIERLTTAAADAPLAPAVLAQAPGIAAAAHPYQRAGVEFCARVRRGLLADQPGLGKASPVSEPVLTPTGWTEMGKLRPGDRVVGSNGRPTRVLGVFPQGPREIVEVTFSDGSVVRCDWNHLWTVRTRDHRKSGKHGWVMTARELVDDGLYIEQGKRRRFDIPMVAPVEYEAEPYPLDAYSVGVLIGDGSLADRYSIGITTDHEIVRALDLPGETKLIEDHGIYGEYRFNGLAAVLRELDLNGKRAEQKSIPTQLLYSSVNDRISLLQGLLDTDGTPVNNRGGRSTSIEYGSVSRRLAEQVRELVQSLGGTASINEKISTFEHRGERRQGQLYYRMVLHLPSGIIPFRLKRKADRWIPRSKYEPSRSIVSIEGTGRFEESVCIRVEARDSLYVTSHHVLTHNTLMTIAAVIAAGVEGDILVLAPKAAVDVTWPEELRRWVPDDQVVIVTGTGAQRHRLLNRELAAEALTPRRWVVCNLEMARCIWVKPTKEFRQPKNRPDEPKRWFPVPGWWDKRYPELFGRVEDENGPFQIPPWTAVIVDESHRGLITTNAHPQGQTQVRAGIGMIPVTEDGIKLGLSGTPFRGKPENLWGTLNWLYPERYSSFWTWARQWFEVFGVPGEETEVGDLDESKSAAFYADIKPIMLRRTKREVRPELPDKLYAGAPLALPGRHVDEHSPVGHWLHMDPKQASAYADIRDDAETQLESGVLVANGVLAELTRLKQFATCYGDMTMVRGDPKFVPKLPSAKFDWLLQFLADLGIDSYTDYTTPIDPDEMRKVVVASQFTSVLDLYADELRRRDIPCLMITGKVVGAARAAAVKAWQGNSGPRVFLLNTNAGGVSLTLDSADDLVFLDETWIPDEQEQVEDRIHRVSRLHQVTIHYLRTMGTIEENIALVTRNRERLTKLLIDGERGVGFAHQLLTPIPR